MSPGARMARLGTNLVGRQQSPALPSAWRPSAKLHAADWHGVAVAAQAASTGVVASCPSRKVCMPAYEDLCRKHCLRHLSLSVASVTRPRGRGYGTAAAVGQEQSTTAEFRRPDAVDWDKDSVNSVSLIGRLGRDVEIRYFDTGKVVSKTSIAVQTSMKQTDPPSWFELEFWDSLAEIAVHHLKKGNMVNVKGRVKIETWTDANDVKRNAIKVSVKEVNFVAASGSKASSSSQNGSQSTQEKQGASEGDASPKMTPERLWQEYFTDPSKWWDNRNNKLNPKSPDFKHKDTKEALWIDSYRTPDWVKEKLDKGEASKGGARAGAEQKKVASSSSSRPAESGRPVEEESDWGDF